MVYPEIKEFQKTLNINSKPVAIDIFVSPVWSASHPNSRQQIRENIIKTLKFKKHDLNKLAKNEILNLNLVPNLTQMMVGLSISHCPGLGGFAYCKLKAPVEFDTGLGVGINVGFDIEEAQRVSMKVVKRVSTKEEILAAPSPEALWVAKEACFKASNFKYPNSQYRLISKIKIHHWQSNHFEFETLKGVVWHYQDFVLGLAVDHIS